MKLFVSLRILVTPNVNESFINTKTDFLTEPNKRNALTDDRTSRGHGSQGIDKAPGEEPSQDTQNVVQETQRGKNKVDGDPTKESDQPIEQGRE